MTLTEKLQQAAARASQVTLDDGVDIGAAIQLRPYGYLVRVWTEVGGQVVRRVHQLTYEDVELAIHNPLLQVLDEMVANLRKAVAVGAPVVA